jgi:hypothetical protein
MAENKTKPTTPMSTLDHGSLTGDGTAKIPLAVVRFGWRYHRLGIPHSSLMRFDTHCQVPEILKTVPHLAFVVDNLDIALQGKQILIPPNSPLPRVRVAFILDDGAPIELLEFAPDSD